jgi:hypothetical protein
LRRGNPPETTASITTKNRLRGSSRLAWRRVGAFIHLPAIALQSSAQQMMVQLSPADLDAALEKDLG